MPKHYSIIQLYLFNRTVSIVTLQQRKITKLKNIQTDSYFIQIKAGINKSRRQFGNGAIVKVHRTTVAHKITNTPEMGPNQGNHKIKNL